MLPSCSLQRVSDHVWWFTPEARRDRPSLAVVVGEHEALLLDVGASPRHLGEFMAALDRAGVRRPARAVLTHWHWDHVFGLGAFAGPVIAHRETAARLARMRTWDFSDAGLPALLADGREIPFTCDHMRLELSDAERRALALPGPDVVFDHRHELDLGGVDCVLQHVGGDHAPDAVVIHVPQDRLLFMGDCLSPDFYVTTPRYTRQNLLPLVVQIEGFQAEVYLEGHGPVTIMPPEIQRWFALIRDAYAALDQAGLASAERVRSDLLGRHGAEPVEEFFSAILAGYRCA